MENVPQNEDDAATRSTRTAYREACAFLGYSTPSREADEVIDHLGMTDDGRRGGRLAAFYPEAMTAAVDRAARLARRHPEALLDESDLALLDLLVATVRT